MRRVKGALAVAHDQRRLADVLGAEDDDFRLERGHRVGWLSGGRGIRERRKVVMVVVVVVVGGGRVRGYGTAISPIAWWSGSRQRRNSVEVEAGCRQGRSNCSCSCSKEGAGEEDVCVESIRSSSGREEAASCVVCLWACCRGSEMSNGTRNACRCGSYVEETAIFRYQRQYRTNRVTLDARNEQCQSKTAGRRSREAPKREMQSGSSRPAA